MGKEENSFSRGTFVILDLPANGWPLFDQNETCEHISIGVTGVTDKPYRAEGVEKLLRVKKLEDKLIEEAPTEVTRDIDVNEDINGSKEYRSHLARVYTARAIETALKS